MTGCLKWNDFCLLASVGVRPQRHSVNTPVWQLLVCPLSKAVGVCLDCKGNDSEVSFSHLSVIQEHTLENLAHFWRLLVTTLGGSECTIGRHYPLCHQCLQTVG